jgi:hypothetical protein
MRAKSKKFTPLNKAEALSGPLGIFIISTNLHAASPTNNTQIAAANQISITRDGNTDRLVKTTE